MTAPPIAPGLSPEPPTIAERWERVPRRWRIALVVLGALIALKLVASIVTGLTGNSSGASGSSSAYDSSSSGTQALAQLLADRGHRVNRLSVPLSAAALAANSTIYVLDPTSWSTADTRAVSQALNKGDRVVLGGPSPAPGVLQTLLGATPAPVWLSVPAGTTHRVIDSASVRGVNTVVSTGDGVYTTSSEGGASGLPLLAGPSGVLAVVDDRRGTLVLLASASSLQNGSLGQNDNAAFGLDLAGPSSSVVDFDEYDHGFGRSGTGLDGLPAAWRWGLGIALVAVLIWMLSAARRFGPPQEADRVMVPARSQYVDAMATLLSTRRPEDLAGAIAPVRDEALRRLCVRLGVAGGSADELRAALVERAAGNPFDEELVGAVFGPTDSAGDVVAVGHALAQLKGEDAYR